MPWSDPLTSPILLRDHRELRTLREAADLLLGLSEARRDHAWVKYAAELLLAAAVTGGIEAIKDATAQMERALGREGML